MPRRSRAVTVIAKARNRPTKKVAVLRERVQIQPVSGSSTRMPLPLPVSGRTRSQAPRSSRRAQGRSGASGLLAQYKNSLINPFDFAPPSILAGSLFPLSRKMLFLRNSFGVSASNTTVGSYIFASIGSAENGSGGIFIGASVNGGVPTWTNQPFSNSQTFLDQAQTGRIVSGGLSVLVRESFTSMPVTIHAGVVYDTWTNFANASRFQVQANPSSRLIRCSDDFQGAYSTFRPMDNAAFELNGLFAAPVPNTGNRCISYVIVQIPTATAINIELNGIYHYQTSAGLDNGVNDDSAGAASQDDEGIELSAEQLGRVAVAIESGPTGPISDLTHAVLDDMIERNARRASNFSLRTEGGLVGSTLPVAPTPGIASQSDEYTHVGRPNLAWR